MLTLSGEQIRNHQVVPVRDANPTCKQCNIKKNHGTRSTLAQKLLDENVYHVNITKPVVIVFFAHFESFSVPIVAKFYRFTSYFVHNLEAKAVVPELATTDVECY